MMIASALSSTMHDIQNYCTVCKKIKELSEQELQDEKVLKVVLKKCFENQTDIGSMAEGKCLEMLTEKIMELVRDVYL